MVYSQKLTERKLMHKYFISYVTTIHIESVVNSGFGNTFRVFKETITREDIRDIEIEILNDFPEHLRKSIKVTVLFYKTID